MSEKLPPIVELAIDSVIVPPDRQREKAEADQTLLTSIERRGLLNPIIVHQDNTLVAGERRLDAFRKLGRTHIPARVFETLGPVAAFEAELQENLARRQLSWQEETKAIGKYHGLRVGDFPGWTQMGTADALGLSQGYLSQVLAIYDAREDEDVFACPTLKGAFNLISARAERATIAAQSRGLIAVEAVNTLLPQFPANATKEDRTAALLTSLKTMDTAAKTVEEVDANIKKIQDGRMAAAALEAQRKLEIVSDLVINADFLEWAETYDGARFDVLHVDFPYGKGYSGARTRKTGKSHIAPIYADDPDVYFGLVEGLLTLQDRLAFAAAHCLFWFDMQYYQWTVDQFTAAGWTLVQPHPFIWSKGYQGIAADVKRRPRHVYETALMFSRGDRKIVKLDKDTIDVPVDEKLHLNQKPVAMLKHFLGIFVDEHTAVLDPTCGSGSALAASRMLGSQRVLGIELDESNADVAKFLLQRTVPAEDASGGDGVADVDGAA